MFSSSWSLTCKLIFVLAKFLQIVAPSAGKNHAQCNSLFPPTLVLALVVVAVVSVAVKKFGRCLRELSQKTQAAAAVAASIAEVVSLFHAFQVQWMWNSASCLNCLC